MSLGCRAGRGDAVRSGVPLLHVRACLSLVAGTVGITGAASVGAVGAAVAVAVQTEALFAIS